MGKKSAAGSWNLCWGPAVDPHFDMTQTVVVITHYCLH